jgi:Na+/H+-dicarboxylate symporter
MLRIVINVVGDGMCTIIVSFRNNFLDVDVYNGKKSWDVDAYKNDWGESDD